MNIIETLCNYNKYINKANALHSKSKRTIKDDLLYAECKAKICEIENSLTDFFENEKDFSDFSHYRRIFHKLIDKKDF